jgi:hypothetical protein
LESNDKNIPAGAVSSSPVTVTSIVSGVIPFKSGSDKSMIYFYGPLTSYELFTPSSGYQAFATPPGEPREIHGSVIVGSAGSEGVELQIIMFHTTRAFDSAGSMAFLFTGSPLAPNIYKLGCSVL